MNTLPLYLVTGFLGSGKTTFVQRAIAHFSGKKKIAIVQNEFAPSSFDGKQLKSNSSNDFALLEINNGSVFCVCLLSGFVNSLQAFVTKYNPEIILMEASGLSDPVSIGQIFNAPQLQEMVYLARTICIVDARNMGNFEKLTTRIHHQLQIADVVLINKTDLAENTEDILQKVGKINPFAQKFLTKHCDAPLESLTVDYSNTQKKLFFVPRNSDRPDVQSAVFRSTRPIKSELINHFLDQLIPLTIRIKGHLLLDNGTSLSVQAIADELHTKIIPLKIRQTELIAMGYQISVRALKDLYQECV